MPPLETSTIHNLRSRTTFHNFYEVTIWICSFSPSFSPLSVLVQPLLNFCRKRFSSLDRLDTGLRTPPNDPLIFVYSTSKKKFFMFPVNEGANNTKLYSACTASFAKTLDNARDPDPANKGEENETKRNLNRMHRDAGIEVAGSDLNEGRFNGLQSSPGMYPSQFKLIYHIYNICVYILDKVMTSPINNST